MFFEEEEQFIKMCACCLQKTGDSFGLDTSQVFNSAVTYFTMSVMQKW